MRLPSGLNPTVATWVWICDLSELPTCFRLRQAQMRTVASSLPVTTRLPSGLKAAPQVGVLSQRLVEL
jgi:hypothetical protein